MTRTKPARSRRLKRGRTVVPPPEVPVVPVPEPPKRMSRPALIVRILVTILGIGYITKVIVESMAAQHR